MAKKTASSRPSRNRGAQGDAMRLDPEQAQEQGNSPHGDERAEDLPTDRAARSDQSRERTSRGKFPVGESAAKAREKAEKPSPTARKAASAAQKAEPKRAQDAVPQVGPANVTAVMDHGALLHPREEHLHRPGEAETRTEGPTPRDPRLVEDENALLEQIRAETKADNLYFMRRRERASAEPRESVIDSINQRLREVQGEPILDE